jgi:hypothetical protein
MKNHYCYCGSKLHKNTLKKHPGPLVCNHCSRTSHFSQVYLVHLQEKLAMQCTAATSPVSTPSSTSATTTIAFSAFITNYKTKNAALNDSIAILTKQVQGLAEQVKQAF